VKRRGEVVALLLVALGAFLVWRGRSAQAPGPEPIRLVPVPVLAFDAGGTLTDAWADVDGDGDPDRFVGFNGAASRLYRNDGTAGFVDVAGTLRLVVEKRVRTSAWGDFDGDGDPDLLLGYAGEAPALALWRNDGPAGFVDVAGSVGLALDTAATRQASWVDVDGDDDLDLFLALRDGPNRLWRNDGGAFTDVTAATGIGDPRRSVGAVWFDADGDGDLDVYVANMDGDANGLWLAHDGVYEDAAEAWGLADGGRALGDEHQGTVRPCAADFDGDGDLDLFTANYGTNGLFRNPGGPGRWENVAADEGLSTDSFFDTCVWGDVDHDGRIDLYVNGTVTGGTTYPDYLFRQGDDGFLDVTPPQLRVEADHGATFVDFDRDGDLDLALTGAEENGMHLLFQNLMRPEYARHALAVRVLDGHGHATRAGALVRVLAAGTERVLGSAVVDSGSGYDSQSDLPVVFGLTNGQPVDVEVTWPANGRIVTVREPGVDPGAHRGGSLEVRVGG
jgi:hypothetical protein